jgi:hypothetical protein
MNSIADAFAVAGFDNILAVHGEVISIISGPAAGYTYAGSISAESNEELNSDLGSDLREKILLRFPRDSWPVGLDAHHRVADESGQLWRVIKRESNPTQPFVSFEVLKVVSGKDT